MSPRGRGRCEKCDRVFTLTAIGTIPGHTVKQDKRCPGSEKPPKDGSVTAR